MHLFAQRRLIRAFGSTRPTDIYNQRSPLEFIGRAWTRCFFRDDTALESVNNHDSQPTKARPAVLTNKPNRVFSNELLRSFEEPPNCTLPNPVHIAST
jgi:hypothetical protein